MTPEEMQDENAELTLCLIKINEIAIRMSKNRDPEIRYFASDIQLYSDAEQRQDGV